MKISLTFIAALVTFSALVVAIPSDNQPRMIIPYRGAPLQFDTQKAIELADVAYRYAIKLYLINIMGTIADGDKYQDELNRTRDELDYSPEYQNLFQMVQELRKILDLSFAADTEAQGRIIAEPVIAFAQALRVKIANVEQIRKDFAITDQALFNEVRNFLRNFSRKGSFYLRMYRLEHVCLYLNTMETLTKEEQEIDALTTEMAAYFHSMIALRAENRKEFYKEIYIYLTNPTSIENPLEYLPRNKKAKDAVLRWKETQDQQIAQFKVSPLIKRLKEESIAAQKYEFGSDAWTEAMYPIIFFLDLLELKVSNTAAIVKKYGISETDELQWSTYLTQSADVQRVLKEQFDVSLCF